MIKSWDMVHNNELAVFHHGFNARKIEDDLNAKCFI